MLDIGDCGRNGGGRVFGYTRLEDAFPKNQFHVLDAEALPGTGTRYPYV